MSALSAAGLSLSDSPASAPAHTSLSSQLHMTTSLINSGSYASASPLLQSLAVSVSSLSLFSKNESLDDIGTKSLPMLAVPYHMAIVRLALAGVEPRGRMDAIESSEGLMKEVRSGSDEVEKGATATSEASRKGGGVHDVRTCVSDV